MRNFLSWHFFLKSLFVALLFTFFVWRFAVPSIQKFLTSGVIVDRSWVRRQPEDSPSVTFCAQNNNTLGGWKITNIDNGGDWHTPALSILCNNPTTVENAVDCLESLTFNLTETIKTTNKKKEEKENELWTQDILELHLGRVFRTHTFLPF